MTRRRTSASSPFLIIGGLVLLALAVFQLTQYVHAQSEIQSQQQYLQEGIVMCGNQQMQPSERCNEHWTLGSFSSSNPGLDEGNRSYDAQRLVNQQAIDNASQSANNQLLEILGFGIFGFLCLIAGLKKSKS
ncbi:MAG TPA: hypothetical protein VFB12_07855 [Ktedonobacteraceae bacterium]|nr:hypothetical protein [Ktedonobacteraceae bacterium]